MPGENIFCIATAGCGLRCKFCQNWTISQVLPEEIYARYTSPEEVVDLAIKKINGEDRESVAEIKIINPTKHEIELKFKGWNWEAKSYLSINPKNIENPDRDCDCRIGANMGFCSHFWIGFIFSLKQNWFKTDDWGLTILPNDFEKKVKSIKLAKDQLGDKVDEKQKSAVLIDESSSSAKLIKYLDTPITIYEAKIVDIVKRESEFQGNITIFYIASLENLKIGPKLKKTSDYREEDTNIVEKLKVRISEKLQNENSFNKGDKINFSGKLVILLRMLEKLQRYNLN